MECPIVGCQYPDNFFINSTGLSDGFRRHLKKSHADCVDVSKVKIFGPIPKRGLLFDCIQNVLVCICTQTVLLNGEYYTHTSKCENCASINLTNELKAILLRLSSTFPENDRRIEGLTRHKGYACPFCKSIMIATKKNWKMHQCNEYNAFLPHECYFQKPFRRRERAFKPDTRLEIGVSSTYMSECEPTSQPNSFVPISRNKRCGSSLVLTKFQKRSRSSNACWKSDHHREAYRLSRRQVILRRL